MFKSLWLADEIGYITAFMIGVFIGVMEMDFSRKYKDLNEPEIA